MKQVIVDRSKWIRGRGSRISRLLVTEETYNGAHGGVASDEEKESWTRDVIGRMCCLGFAEVACGVAENKLADVGYVEEVGEGYSDTPVELQWLLDDDDIPVGSDEENWGRVIAKINDDRDITDTEREALLRKLFAGHGIEMIFVDQVLEPEEAEVSP